jgi:hypothetical protein
MGLATIESSVTARQSLLVDRFVTRPILELAETVLLAVQDQEESTVED